MAEEGFAVCDVVFSSNSVWFGDWPSFAIEKQ